MKVIPILTVSHAVLFPYGQLPLPMRERHATLMIEDLYSTDQEIGLLFVKDTSKFRLQFGEKEPAQIGCIGTVEMVERLPYGRLNLLLRGQKRFFIQDFITSKPVLRARIQTIEEQDFPLTEAEKGRLTNWLYERIHEYLKVSMKCDAMNLHWKFDDIRLAELINQAAMYLDLSLQEKQHILELSSLEKKYQFVSNFIEEKLAVARFSKNKMCILENPVLN
ncbi:LON peptidase substrate-binding domain-containing protein [candidate division KSB1 bacterium]|nr:LON peptidase substrate-binding domain-containing protein [candidate division KSB1 bacterium]